jgi:triacylglycerol lipase
MRPENPMLIVVLAVAVAIAVQAGLWLFLWLRSRRADGRVAPTRVLQPLGLRYPVVLAHGLMGFDEIKLGSIRSDYFRGVQARLGQAGHKVHTIKVSRAGSVEVRAKQLADAVRAVGAQRVNIIAHSMGGLDARFAISRLGLADRVASLTTIGTPHGGTPIADIGTGLGSMIGLKRALDALGIDVNAFYDLTTARMAAFNREVPDVKGVSYGSVIACIAGGLLQMNPLLVPPYLFLSEKAGANDGLVPGKSQTWGEVLKRIDADHWAQIGWSTRFDAPAFYAQLIEVLKERGF